MELHYRIVNVFAREGRLTGNPLCVFEDGASLDGETMQALARQFFYYQGQARRLKQGDFA